MISDGVSLSDKLRGRDRGFVPEHGAFNARLGWDGVVDIFSPNKESVSSRGPQDDVESGADKLKSGASISIGLFSGVMSRVEFQARLVSVLCEIPIRHRPRALHRF